MKISNEIPQPEKNIKYLIDLTKQYHNMLEREMSDKEKNSRQTFLWDGNVSAMIDEDRSMDFYLQDDLGSPIRFMDEDGELIDSYGYDEFGQDLYGNQGLMQPFGYTGYQSNKISETYFAQAREYSGFLSRFLSEDAYIYMDFSDLECLNLYDYCFSNPINFVDVSGNDAYILYLPEWEKEAKNDKKIIKREYGLSDDEIHLIAVTNNQSFKEAWNNMGKDDGEDVNIDLVIINTHGSRTTLSYGKKNDGYSLGFDDIKNLEEKEMGGLLLYGCNTGHLDHPEENIAYEFSKIVNGAPVIAPDGKVLALYSMKDFGSRKYKCINGKSFKANLTNGDRKPMGWIIYQYDGTNIITEVLGKKGLTLAEMIDYLEEYCNE